MGRAILIIGGGALLVGVWIYALIDSVRAESSEVRTLPKPAWIVITFLFPVIGSLLWLFFGRPRYVRNSSIATPFSKSRGPVGTQKAPDDDEDFLRFLEQKARREEESRRRAQEMKQDQQEGKKDGGSSPGAPDQDSGKDPDSTK